MARRREFDEAQVVEQAMELFWLQGFRATTPQNLVDATGLSKSSLYATFESKQGLFVAALTRYIQGQVQVMRGMLESCDLATGLERLYETLITTATDPAGGKTCLMCSTALDASPEEPDVAALVAQGHRAVEEVLHEWLVRAQEAGELAADRDPRAVARFILNNNMGLMVLARTNNDPQSLRPIANEIIRAIV